jgi:hypothetical protein
LLFSSLPELQNIFHHLFSPTTCLMEHFSSPLFTNHMVTPYWLVPRSCVSSDLGVTSDSVPTVGST